MSSSCPGPKKSGSQGSVWQGTKTLLEMVPPYSRPQGQADDIPCGRATPTGFPRQAAAALGARLFPDQLPSPKNYGPSFHFSPLAMQPESQFLILAVLQRVTGHRALH